MFRHLRLALTSLYMLAALLLLALIGGGTWLLVNNYFQNTTDSALQHKMVHEFVDYNLPIPADLTAADRNWYLSQGQQPPPLKDTSASGVHQGQPHPGDGGDHAGNGPPPPNDAANQTAIEDAYIGELASIYTLQLDANGQVISGTTSVTSEIKPNADAIANAMKEGLDWRTVSLNGQARVRLLTYRMPQTATTPGSTGIATAGPVPSVVQLGRVLSDQDGVMQRILMGLLILGGGSILILGFASWWLAGRSLKPAQEAWERQQQFVANASHELRAPLTLMRASTEVALRTTLQEDTDQRELLQDVLHECDHMNTLVEDLLLLSRLDAGRIALERRPVRLDEMLSEVQRQVGRLADERGIRLIVGSTGRVPAALGDPTRLRQVLLIVLDNALRYTPRGGTINLSAAAHGRQVELIVEDSGKGIPPEHLPHIFERFYRVEEARGEEGTGNGLGLSIARSLIDAQSGHIGITSKPGQGTRVTVALPATGDVMGGREELRITNYELQVPTDEGVKRKT